MKEGTTAFSDFKILLPRSYVLFLLSTAEDIGLTGLRCDNETGDLVDVTGDLVDVTGDRADVTGLPTNSLALAESLAGMNPGTPISCCFSLASSSAGYVGDPTGLASSEGSLER